MTLEPRYFTWVITGRSDAASRPVMTHVK